MKLKNNIRIIEKSGTSKSLTVPFLFIKYVIEWIDFDVYKREKFLATILKDFDWYPKLLYSDDINHILVFNNVGVVLESNNKPDDLEEQFNKILADMKSVNIQHNDIKIGELLINKDNKIFLCDFGWGSINNDFGCGIGMCKKPPKCFLYTKDKDTLKRLKLI